jgi:protein-S-isoprenylcysteine O-methyltransferase Ste14
LLYSTWTTLYFASFAPLMFFRARCEKKVLVEEFDEQWREYFERIHAFIPCLRKEQYDQT